MYPKMYRRYSTIWNYFNYIETGNGMRPYAMCNFCPRTFETRNTTTMLLHLKAEHTTEYIKALDDRLKNPIQRIRKFRKAPKPKPRKQKRSKKPIKIPKSQRKDIQRSKDDPEIIFENEIVSVSDESNSHFVDVTAREYDLRPLLIPLQTTDENSYNSYTYSSEEKERDISQQSLSQVCAVRQLPCNTSEGSDSTMNSALSNISIDLKYLKDKISSADKCFFLSVASELAVLPEESKDVLKAAIWHVICEVKRAKRKNKELSILTLFK